MSKTAKGPRGLRRGRGARERILGAARELFQEQGINSTGMDQLCAVAQVSKRTAYQHFASKDDLIAGYLQELDPDTMAEIFDRTDLPACERLLAVFDPPTAGPGVTGLCPFIAAAVEIADSDHPARARAREYKRAVTDRLVETAREAGAADPELLGQQLALLLDGASARTRTLGAAASPTARSIAVALIDQALADAPARQQTSTAQGGRRRRTQPLPAAAQ